MAQSNYVLKRELKAVPGGPVFKASPCNAGGKGLILIGTRIPHASRSKIQNRSSIATNSIKALSAVIKFGFCSNCSFSSIKHGLGVGKTEDKVIND